MRNKANFHGQMPGGPMAGMAVLLVGGTPMLRTAPNKPNFGMARWKDNCGWGKEL
jgi:hypothetical protein